MKSLLFFDLKATGPNACFDQPVEVMAIRLGGGLEVVEETKIKFRLREDVVPSLHSLEATGRLPSDLVDGDREYHAALRLHTLFNRPGTVSIGYDSFGFGDRMMAFMFFRNLLHPYTHRYQSDCGRADVLGMVAVFALFAPEVLRIPTGENASPTFDLAELAQANGIDVDHSQEARGDVGRTISLFRKMHAARPEIVDWLMKKFGKAYDTESVSRLERIPAAGRSFPFGLLVDAGAHDTNYQRAAIKIGNDEHGESWMVIENDFESYLKGEASEPPQVLKRNSGDLPLVLPYSKAVLDEPRRKRIETNRALLRTVGIVPFLAEGPPPTKPEHVDFDALLDSDGILDVFRTSQEDIERFHQAMTVEIKHRDALVMANPKFREIALRILYRNHDDHPIMKRAAGDFHRLRRLGGKGADGVDHLGGARRTILDLRKEIETTLLNDPTTERRDFIDRVSLEFQLAQIQT